MPFKIRFLGRRHIQPRSCMGGADAVKRVRERSCLWKEKRAQGQLRRSAPKTSLIFSQRTYKFMFKSLIHCELCSVRGVRMDICAASFVCDFFSASVGELLLSPVVQFRALSKVPNSIFRKTNIILPSVIKRKITIACVQESECKIIKCLLHR